MIFQGTSIFKSYAVGNISFINSATTEAEIINTQNIDCEIEKFYAALSIAKNQLQELHLASSNILGSDTCSVFEAHKIMLDDPEFIDLITNTINEKKITAEAAIQLCVQLLANQFLSLDDDILFSRSDDIKDIGKRLIRILRNDNIQNTLSSPAIIVAKDLSPSDIISLNRDNVLAIVLENTSLNSHAALLIRTMSIPSLTGIDISSDMDGKTAIVDSINGRFIVNPDISLIEEYKNTLKDFLIDLESDKSLIGKPDTTKDGVHINLYANICDPDDIASVINNDASGIGLFRSEFIYLKSSHLPTEEEQFNIYRTVLEGMNGKPVTIRTIDLGSDKPLPYLQLEKEDNPALGLRAIRLCLKYPDLFKTQLRALYRSSIYGNLNILFPMISSLDEINFVKSIISEVKDELIAKKHSFNDVKVGIMIEVPAAVQLSDVLAKEVDFFSIGTNDLIQYMFAMDRQNPELNNYSCNYVDPLLNAVSYTVNNAHNNNIEVFICGEIAADSSLTERLIKTGIDGLSVNPSSILKIRKAINNSIKLS